MDPIDTPKGKVHSILFSGLKQIIPTLQPANISIEEGSYKHTNDDVKSMLLVKKWTGASHPLGVQTNITLEGVNLSLNRMMAIKEILDNITGTWSDCDGKSWSFKGSITGLAELLDRNEFVRLVKEEVEPMERGNP